MEQSRTNLDRTAAALRELGARRITNAGVHSPEGESPPENSYQLTERVEMFFTEVGRLDVLKEATVIGRYEDIWPRAIGFRIDGNDVFVADLETIIKAKEAANRPKDRVHLLSLYDLRDDIVGLGRPLSPSAEIER